MKFDGTNAYIDVDWVGSISDILNMSGYCTFVGGILVTWRSKKQPVVARSSVEVGFKCNMAQWICELLWLQGL